MLKAGNILFMIDNKGQVDFIIVGAMKSGTSSLAFHLSNHPDIYMPESEVHFFNDDEAYEKGYQHYLNQFEYLQNKIVGEKTPTYSYLKKCPERIYDFNANVKLIWIFRNPVDRAYSNYWHAVKRGGSI